MKEYLKKMTIVCILLCGAIILFPKAVSAEEGTTSNSSTTGNGSYLISEGESEYSFYPRLRGLYLMNGSCALSKVGPRIVSVYATTVGHVKLSSIKVSASLEIYLNGKWQRASGWSNTEYNSNYVSTYRKFEVTGGYYYRAKGFHTGGGEFLTYATRQLYIP